MYWYNSGKKNLRCAMFKTNIGFNFQSFFPQECRFLFLFFFYGNGRTFSPSLLSDCLKDVRKNALLKRQCLKNKTKVYKFYQHLVELWIFNSWANKRSPLKINNLQLLYLDSPFDCSFTRCNYNWWHVFINQSYCLKVVVSDV